MKRIVYYVILMMGIVSMSGCQKEKSESLNTEIAEETEQNMESEEDALKAKLELATHDCQVVREGEMMSLNGMNITVNDVTVTRKKGDWHDFLITKLDENGYMTEDIAYVVINVSVERTAENESFWLNSLWLAYFTDEDMRIGDIEIDGTTLFKTDDGNPDAYAEVLEAGETLTTDLVYIIKEDMSAEIENTHFLLHYNKTGGAFSYTDPEDNCMTYLRTLEGVWNEITMEE